jgi:YVTN family beta-propeller protein
MRFAQRATILIAVAIAGPAVAAPTIAAAAPASFPSAMAHGTNGRCKLTATIPVGNGPSGVAANPKTNTIYVPNESDTVLVINGRTNKVTATVGIVEAPGESAVDPRTNTVYVPNGNNNDVSVISGRTNTVTATSR